MIKYLIFCFWEKIDFLFQSEWGINQLTFLPLNWFVFLIFGSIAVENVFLSDCLFMVSCTINLLILQYNVSLSFFHLGVSAVSWQKWQPVMLFWRDWSRRVQKQIKLLNILSNKLLFLRRKQVRKFENLSFLRRYLKWIHIVTAKKICLPDTILLHSLDDDFCILLILQLWVNKYSGIKIS